MDNQYYIDNFLAQLREGQSIDDLAKALARNINEANRIYEEERVAKRKEQMKHAAHVDCADDLLCAAQDFLASYDVDITPFNGISGEDFVKTFEATVLPILKKCGDLKNLWAEVDKYLKINFKYNEPNKGEEKTIKINQGTYTIDFDASYNDPIEAFLDKYVRNKNTKG